MNVEVLELVRVLALRDHAKPIAELLLLEVLLREVLDVLLGEGDAGDNSERRLLPGDPDRVAELTGLAVDLDAVVQVLLEGVGVHDTVLHGVGEIDHEPEDLLLGLALALDGLGLLSLLGHLGGLSLNLLGGSYGGLGGSSLGSGSGGGLGLSGGGGLGSGVLLGNGSLGGSSLGGGRLGSGSRGLGGGLLLRSSLGGTLLLGSGGLGGSGLSGGLLLGSGLSALLLGGSLRIRVNPLTITVHT